MYFHRSQRKEILSTFTVTCSFCNQEVKKHRKSRISSKQNYCNKSCAAKHRVKNGVINVSHLNSKSWVEWYREKHGDEETERMLELRRLECSNRSLGEKNPMYGKHHTAFVKMLATFSQSGISYEQRYGLQKSSDMKRKISEKVSGKKNGMFGRTSRQRYKTNIGRNGTYKGKFFRSILELSFLKHLENLGISIDDIQYEHYKIPYIFNNEAHVYIADFYVPKLNVLYEVKHSTELNEPKNVAKFYAAKEYCNKNNIQFQIVTQNDFQVYKRYELEKDREVFFYRKTETEKEKNMKLDDSVLHRIVQIVQEGFLMGIDVADLMRQIQLKADPLNSNVLLLDPEYVKQVTEMHEKSLAEAAKKKSELEIERDLLV